MKVTIRLEKNDNGDFVARCTSLPGCVTHGKSRREAKHRISEAIRGYVAAVNNFEPEHLEEEVLET
jgi:predicted RNase H-like HicB family nuclease